MEKISLQELFSKQLRKMTVIISVGLLVMIFLFSTVIYNQVYLKEKQHISSSIAYFFQETEKMLMEAENIYNQQLRSSLKEFYRNYETVNNYEYTANQTARIKRKLDNLVYTPFKIEQVNYYFINPHGEIFATDYQPDQGLDLSRTDLWTRLKQAEAGEVLTLPLDDETLTGRIRLYSYVKLPDDNIFEIGILFKNINQILKQKLNYISQEETVKLQLFAYDFTPYFAEDELTAAEKDLLQTSIQQDKVIHKSPSLFKNIYYRSWDSKYGNRYIKVKVNYQQIKMILAFTGLLFLLLVMLIKFYGGQIRNRLQEVVGKLSLVISDIKQFSRSQTQQLPLEETEIIEINNLIDSYTEMANEINASYQQLEAYSEKLEDKNDKLKTYSKQLKAEKQKLRQVIDLSSNLIFIKDYDGNFLLSNSTHAEVLGSTVEEIVGKNQRELTKISEAAINKFLADDREVIDTKLRKETEAEIIDQKTGQQRIFQTTKIPFEQDGETYILGVAREVTEERKREEKIRQQKEELEGSYQEIQFLVYKLEKLIELTSNLTANNYEREEDFLSSVLETAIEIMEEADCGSIYLFDEGQVRFVDAVGHDLEQLQQLEIEKAVFSAVGKEVCIIDQIMNYSLPKLNAEAKEKFKAATLSINQSLVFGLFVEGERIGGISLDISAEKDTEFSLQSINLAEAFQSLIISFYTMERYNQVQKEFQREIVIAMIKMLEIHDKYTKGHSENVAKLAREIAQKMGLTPEEVKTTYWAGMIHDIGKTVVPASILNKKGKLTDEEYEQIKQHPVWGYDALKNLQQLEDIARYVHYHHEYWDGSGYPEGLAGDEIPLISQILTIADAWDAMRSNRPYRNALPREVAVKEIKDNKGGQFSPQVVEVFLQIKENS